MSSNAKGFLTLIGSIVLVVACTYQAAAATPGFVYALQQINNGTNQIYGYRIDPVTGALSPLPGFPMATGGKGSFGEVSEQIAYSGGRLYVINSGSATLSAYTVSPSSGALTALPFSPIALGADGFWDCVACMQRCGLRMALRNAAADSNRAAASLLSA